MYDTKLSVIPRAFTLFIEPRMELKAPIRRSVASFQFRWRTRMFLATYLLTREHTAHFY